jgi:oxalate decarboxylase
MGVFNIGPNVLTMDLGPGDIGYIKRTYGHYLENVGDLEFCRSDGCHARCEHE